MGGLDGHSSVSAGDNRDVIRNQTVKEVTLMSSLDDVRKASGAFYVALNRMVNGKAGSMADVWSHGTDVTAMHPIGGREVGWEAVRSSFEQVAQLASEGKVELRDQMIQVVGDMAYEIGVERGEMVLAGRELSMEHRVTNVYRRMGGTWKVVHHHTDSSPTMIDLLSQLQGE